MVAADARTAVTFSLSPGQAGDAPEGRKLLKTLEKKGFDKLDCVFMFFIHFALITDEECVNTPPAKAGGFGLRLKAGSIGHTADLHPLRVKVGKTGSAQFNCLY
jgi:hypothetical protein